MRTRIGASIVAVLLFVVLGAADSTHGDITGIVTDAVGTALPGVRVSLAGPARRAVTTNERGEFSFKNLPPGSYETRFELTGFITAASNVTLRAGRTEHLTIKMQLAARAEIMADTTPQLKRETGVAEGAIGGVVGGLPASAPAGLGSGIGGGMYVPGRYIGPFHTEAYDHFDDNTFRRVVNDPLSTFSIDVDTASYANVRRFLNQGTFPPAGAVRTEELINYFRFDYPQPNGDAPFSVTTELAACPWNTQHRLALIGLQGRAVSEKDKTARNLVFLIDVSGSMDSPDKLPLVRNAMRMLADILDARDRVGIVVYAGASGLVLPSTPGDQKSTIHNAIADLRPGGSTNGAAGITLAYRVAREHFIKGAVNRVILATDGDFNVGVTSQDELVRLIEEQRESGIFLSVLGVGTGNLKDSTMEKLADKGNGNYAYLDSLQEARKVLVHEAGSTLMTIAKDVKIQIEFNPSTVAAYRLIGYENRLLKNEDFNNDKKDAGEIGSGHSVTALYEIVPAGVAIDESSVDPLKYQQQPQPTRAATSGELATVKLRYKAPDGETSKLIATVLRNRPQPMGANLGFASAVAEFGMLLRESKVAGNASYQSVLARAQAFRGSDPEGYRSEFAKLVDLAAGLRRMTYAAQPQ
jgi:Ca-activated chloride channel family protein